jgi:murein DD-endopeptidase MepM/ murein hydrolase activator NlpD
VQQIPFSYVQSGKKMIAESPLSTLRISIADMIRLRVRARRPGQDAPPEFLYQELPTDALSIVGTIPRGTFAVSIPHQNLLGCGYEIVRTPPMGDGFVIVYARQANRRYEAVRVLFRGKTIGIEDFHEEACQWINGLQGRIKAIPNHYAYFSPARDHWAVVLRDNGYTVLDPSRVPKTITQELGEYQKNQNGEVLARVPVYAGQKQLQGATLPVFSQIELTSDPDPNPGSHWISFIEYQKARAFRSLPPVSIVPGFFEWLKLLTVESGFEHWIFRPGMMFGDRIEWWGDRNRRRTEHEGLDFVEGLQQNGTTRSIPESTPIYAMADGDVVAILDDFLGKTVVMRHPAITHEGGDVFYTFLSHIRSVSNRLRSATQGSPIGRVGKSANARVPAHLHLTAAWIPQAIHPNTITLDHLHPANTSVVLLNFNELINSSPLCVVLP